MIKMYNRRETGNDRITMQCLQRVNVMYMDNLAHMILPCIETVHKQVEIKIADGSKKHNFTNLSREFMWLSSTDANGKEVPLFEVIIPFVSGMQSGSAVVTYRNDSNEAAILIRKIWQSVALWFFGYWTHVIKYKNGMIKKLMESFNIDAAKLAALLTFDVEMCTVDVEVPNVDRQLNDLKANLGITHWAADLEEIDEVKMTISGHREALAQTLHDHVNDIDNAEHSGPSRRTDFSISTGNSTNNSEATICQHQR
jgi:hypothetical protein